MTDTPPDDTPSDQTAPDSEKPTLRKTAVNAAKHAHASVESAGKVTETFGTAISAIKWIAIAVTMGFLFGFGLLVYKLVSAPAKAAANATESVTDAVKSGTSAVTQGASDVMGRLIIPSLKQAQTNKWAETAFANLNGMTPMPPESLTARAFWAANLAGHENRVCQLSINFGGGDIPIILASDNKAHASAKSLGSKNDRVIRIIIRAEGNDMPLRVEWNEASQNWVMKWRSTTVKKPLEDTVAAQRISDILSGTDKC